MGAMSLPPGFRFHPTDDELVGYYLKRKVDGVKIELEVIPVVDLYKFDPWELPDKSFLPMRDMEWFFFVPRDRKYPNGTRTNRATGSGYWKATGKDRKVVCEPSVTGLRKTLVFYKGRAPAGDRTDWVMHEYRLCEELPHGNSSFVGAFALCRIIKRSEHMQKTSEAIGEPKLKRAAYSTNSLYSGSRSDDILDVQDSHAEMFQSRISIIPPTISASENKSGSEAEPIVIDSDRAFNENSDYLSDASEAFLARDVHSELDFPIQLTNSLIHSPPYISSQIPIMLPYTCINGEACVTSNINESGSAMLHSLSSSTFMDMHTSEAYAGYPSLDFGSFPGNVNLPTNDVETWNPVMLPPICRQTSGDGSGELNFWVPDESVSGCLVRGILLRRNHEGQKVQYGYSNIS